MINRKAIEFAKLDAGPNGFSLTGSGKASVYAPGATLPMRFDLGPSNPYNQYSVAGRAWALANGYGTGTPTRTAQVVFNRS